MFLRLFPFFSGRKIHMMYVCTFVKITLKIAAPYVLSVKLLIVYNLLHKCLFVALVTSENNHNINYERVTKISDKNDIYKKEKKNIVLQNCF